MKQWVLTSMICFSSLALAEGKKLTCQVGEVESGLLTNIKKQTVPVNNWEVIADFENKEIAPGLTAVGRLTADQLNLSYLDRKTGIGASTITMDYTANLYFSKDKRYFRLDCWVLEE